MTVQYYNIKLNMARHKKTWQTIQLMHVRQETLFCHAQVMLNTSKDTSTVSKCRRLSSNVTSQHDRTKRVVASQEEFGPYCICLTLKWHGRKIQESVRTKRSLQWH